VEQSQNSSRRFDIVIVGAGAAGIAIATSLLKRSQKLTIAIIDHAEKHYYQPGWTMVGAGVFNAASTERPMSAIIPDKVRWIKSAAANFDPQKNTLELEDGSELNYQCLVVAPGLKLNWAGIDGLEETLGQNGVTSNYRYDLAPYTWQLVQQLQKGTAVFTQPPMPIKCAGAPQKALYLSADYWHSKGLLDEIAIQFCNAGAVLFGVADYVPALMQYIEKYRTQLNFSQNLVKVDGPARTAWFEKAGTDGQPETVATQFDMLHVCPPQQAPDFIRQSKLADAQGWVDVDQETLRHKKYDNIWAAGDVMNAPNAKTAAAARMQAPIVAHNILSSLDISKGVARYNGYGSCPLTVERGKIVLAEFGFGGKLLPSFPKWFIDGKQPTRAAWFLKKSVLPGLYWNAMLKGHEWLVKPDIESS